MPKKMDKKTQSVLDEGQHLQDLVGSTGWKIARHRLNEAILSVGNIMDITDKDPNTVMIQLAARQMAIEMVFNWFRDIEGTALQHKSYVEQMAEVRKEEFLMRFEEESEA